MGLIPDDGCVERHHTKLKKTAIWFTYRIYVRAHAKTKFQSSMSTPLLEQRNMTECRMSCDQFEPMTVHYFKLE